MYYDGREIVWIERMEAYLLFCGLWDCVCKEFKYDPKNTDEGTGLRMSYWLKAYLPTGWLSIDRSKNTRGLTISCDS